MSHKTLKAAIHSVRLLFRKNRGLSFKSVADYKKEMKLVLTQLNAAGYQLFNIRHLKTRHIEYLLKQWKEQKIGVGTIKNRMSKLRFVCKLVGKSYVIPRSNYMLDIGKRTVSTKNKPIPIIDVNKIKNDYIRYSVRLQQEFGLRREESIKFIPSLADKGEYIRLKSSWTKGGIERTIPIVRESQRKLLDELKKFVRYDKSLIPDGSNYRKQENVYVSQVRQAGFKNLHKLRNVYAQRRYQELTKLMNKGKVIECPSKSGTSTKQLTDREKQIDYRARTIIADELGHSRPQITKIYL